MIDMYCALVLAGKRTFDSIPNRYKGNVKQALLSMGLDENGDVIAKDENGSQPRTIGYNAEQMA